MNRHQRRTKAKLDRATKSSVASPGGSTLPPALAQIFQSGVNNYQAGRLGEAENCYRRVLAVRPEDAGTLCNLGTVLHKQGRLDDAVAAYRKALRINPHLALSHANLGSALKDQRNLDEAIKAFHQAILIDPSYYQVHYNLGDAYYLQEKLNDAVAAYRNTINLKPDFADAHNALGAALMDLGQLSEAREAFEKAIELAPDNTRFRRGLSILTRFSAGEQQLGELERFAKNNSTRSIKDQIELHFALGKAYDDAGCYADAFREWVEGNALKRQQIDYDEAATLAELGNVRSTYTAELIQKSQGTGNSSSRPVFIVGMPRSGSTLVEQILASHPQVYGAGELPYFSRSVEKALATSDKNKGMRDVAANYLAEIERIAPISERVIDKLPRNFILAGLIHLALPNAPIIHTIRDPIDTCLSCFSILFTYEQDFTYDLAELGRYYRGYRRLMEHWHRVLPQGRILDVRYEDVVADLEGQARRIVAHCGLEWDARCLDFHKTERPVRTASATQVREPLYDRAVGRWRHYADFLAPLVAELPLEHSVSRRN